jgi:hypothetical protein
MRIAVVLFVAATCSACLRSTTVIAVKSDGSGTIVQETGVSPQMLSMLQSMAGGGSAQAPPVKEMFGEEQARKAAEAMGVQFVSGEPIKTSDLEGYRARFAFADIGKLRMRLNQQASGSMGGDAPGDPPFGFQFQKGTTSSRLTIDMPDMKSPTEPLGFKDMAGNAEQMQQAMTMMKMMTRGMFVDVSLDVDGRILKTDAQHVQGSRVTLLQLDFDKILADEAGLQKLQKATDVKALAGVPGLKIVTTPTLNIEFAK